MVGAKIISLQRHSTPEVYVLPKQHFWTDNLRLREPLFAVATTIYIKKYLEEVCDRIWCETNIPYQEETRQGMRLVLDQNSLEWVFLSVSTKALPVLIPPVEERYRRVLGGSDVEKVVYDGEHGRFTLTMSRGKMYCSITAHSDAPGIQRRRLFSSLRGMFKRSLRQALSQKRDVGQDMSTVV